MIFFLGWVILGVAILLFLPESSWSIIEKLFKNKIINPFESMVLVLLFPILAIVTFISGIVALKKSLTKNADETDGEK